jgi:hypothetical protein
MTISRQFAGRSVFGFALTIFLALFYAPQITYGSDALRYEYKLVRLGSLSPLQKDDTAAGAKMSEVEKKLNDAGLEGWEMVNVFAVRTTFDPNVFFAVMKRPLPAGAGETSMKGDERP